jgi:hypothetical protein
MSPHTTSSHLTSPHTLATIRLYWKRKHPNKPQTTANSAQTAPTQLKTYEKEVTQIFPTEKDRGVSNTTHIRAILGPLLVKNVDYCKTLVYYNVSGNTLRPSDPRHCVSLPCVRAILPSCFSLPVCVRATLPSCFSLPVCVPATLPPCFSLPVCAPATLAPCFSLPVFVPATLPPCFSLPVCVPATLPPCFSLPVCVPATLAPCFSLPVCVPASAGISDPPSGIH